MRKHFSKVKHADAISMDESYKNPDHILIDVYWNKNYPQTQFFDLPRRVDERVCKNVRTF